MDTGLPINLSSVRVVITDPDERYPKVHWGEAPAGTAFESLIEWDGRWADRSQAQPGEYLAWVKTAHQAGNESFAVGRIRCWAIEYSKTLPYQTVRRAALRLCYNHPDLKSPL